MERIKIRSMLTFILSSLINAGIGFAVGLIVAIISVIVNGGNGVWISLTVPVALFTFATALLSSNMYRLYFYYTLSLDINAVCEGDGEESESYVAAAVLSTITLGAYRVYWTYKLAKRLRANAPRYGFKMVETGKDIAILNVLSFGYIGAWELIKNTNRIAKVYNQSGLAENVGGVQ